MGALDGVRVVDLSRLLPGPFCTAVLADHGAEVTVVEAPRFRDDPVLGHVPMIRRNKRHLALDLKSEEGKRILYRLVEQADVLVEGFRPGVARRLGADYETLSSVNPALVYCSLTGYGQDGPLADRAGHDLNYMALTGMLDLVRDKEGEPVQPNFQMADLSGSLYAVVGIVMGLLARQRTGRGQHIDVAMTDGLISLLALPLTFAFTGQSLPGKTGSESRDAFACYKIYRTLDGEHVSVGPLEPHLWKTLCEKLECPQYAPLQYDTNAREEIVKHFEAVFGSRTLAEWEGLLNAADDCTAVVTRMRDLAKIPQFVHRGMVRVSPDGIPEPGIAPLFSETPGSYRRPPYTFGEHSEEVLSELGYLEEEIAKLVEVGVVWKAGE
jgi:crotonobetainyl-CoA:carnitine CoA-transferase CaiB-like acyl-CoA transferase